MSRAVLIGAVAGGLAIAGLLHLVEERGYDRGVREATANAEAQQQSTERAYADQRAQAAKEHLQAYQQQVARTTAAEEDLAAANKRIEALNEQISNRIPQVTTVYRPAPEAEPVAIPHCVFTRGWLRDYNAALGATASLPATGASPSNPAAQAAPEPAPGADAELLESGVTPSDILAHARDYGAWAQSNLRQLNGLLDLYGEPDGN